jgi:hypothetical protein
MNLHNLLGWVSSILFVSTLWGALHQTILLKKLVFAGARDKFSNLSVSYFFAYFLGVFLFFTYGYLLPEADYFLIATRGAATFLAVLMLTFLWLGKKSALSFSALPASARCSDPCRASPCTSWPVLGVAARQDHRAEAVAVLAGQAAVLLEATGRHRRPASASTGRRSNRRRSRCPRCAGSSWSDSAAARS